MSYRYGLHGNRDHLDEQDDTEKRSSRVTLRVYAQVKVLLTAPKPISPRLDPDQQERLEKAGVAFVRPDGTMAGRVIAEHALQLGMDADWSVGAHTMR